jgi:hypothetical protein
MIGVAESEGRIVPHASTPAHSQDQGRDVTGVILRSCVAETGQRPRARPEGVGFQPALLEDRDEEVAEPGVLLGVERDVPAVLEPSRGESTGRSK